MKNLQYLLTIAIVVGLAIVLIPSRVTAQGSDNSYLSAPPLIYVVEGNSGFSINYENPNPVIYTDNGNVTLTLLVRLPYEVNSDTTQGNVTMQNSVVWLGEGYLTSVSYKASWQNNRTINLYTNPSTELYNVQYNQSQGEFLYNLTNIPYGNQQLEVYASCIVIILANGYSSTSPLFQTATNSIDFTVAPTLTPNPTSPTSTPSIILDLNSEQNVTILATAISVTLITVMGLLLFRRHRKTRNLNQ